MTVERHTSQDSLTIRPDGSQTPPDPYRLADHVDQRTPSRTTLTFCGPLALRATGCGESANYLQPAGAAGQIERPAFPAVGERERSTAFLLADWQLRSIKAAVEEEPHRWSLKALAALLGLAETRFCKAFRASMGIPPHQWIIRNRTERAKTLLAERELTLTDIAYACGYSSSSHFSTSFGDATGMTPSQYRRRCARPLNQTNAV